MSVHSKTRRVAALAAVLGLALAAWPASATVRPALAADEEELGSPMWYDQVLQHEGETYDFVPGEAVTTPYVPRPGDRTLVNGQPAVALPPGRASGKSMAETPEGTIWAEPDAPERTLLAAATTAAETQASAARVNVLRREVYGFLPYWEAPYSDDLNYDILSTVAYFGVAVRSNGDLARSKDGKTTTQWAGWTSSWMTNVINEAHAHGTRVALAVTQFAWTAGGRDDQAALLSSPEARLNAAQQIAAAVRDRGADGVNLDFEPIVSSQGDNYVTFVQTLRAELDKLGPGYELVYCATGSIGYYNHAALTSPGAADAVWIMGYDFRTGSSSYAGAISPLTSPRPVYDLTQVIGLYKARVSVSKIILGLPWYGIAWSTVSNEPNANVLSGSGCRPTSVLFGQAFSLASENGRNYDSIEHSAWTAYKLDCGDTDGSGNPVQTWRELYYDDHESLGVKYDMINYWNLRGMGIWALGYSYGHPELDNQVAAKFLTDKTPPLAGIVNMESLQLNEGFAVSWRGREDWNGIAGYDVQVSDNGGAYADWLTDTTLITANFQGLSGHNYSFRVRATDGVGNVGPWNVGNAYTASPAFAVGGFARAQATMTLRSSPSTSASPIGTLAEGSVAKIIGGPVSDGGLTWYQVTGPYNEVESIEPQFPGPWVAVTDGSTEWVVPITPPNTTAIAAGIGAYTIGTPGMMPSGTGLDRGKVFSPDGDGIRDTLPLSWTNTVAMDSMTLTVYDDNDQPVGTIALGSQPTGPQSYTWDGKVGPTVLPDGRYLLQLTGVSGENTYYDPTPPPFDEGQMTSLGVIIDTTPSGTYHAIAPTRILDTRRALGLSGPLISGRSQTLKIAGQGVVPANAIAVTGNLTVSRATAAGYVRFGPSVATNSSTINFPAGDNRANGVTLGLAADGSLSAIFNSSDGRVGAHQVQLIFDVTGYFTRDASGATYFPVSPNRIVDTRKALGISAALTPGKVATFNVAGLAGVPANAVAVTGNATVTRATGTGYIAIAPKISGVPGTSTLNFKPRDNRANNVTVQLSGGKLQVAYSGPSGTLVHFIFDVTGYFVPGTTGATFVPLTPGRVVDSRSSLGFRGPLTSGGWATFKVIGLASVKNTAVAVVGNLTCTRQTVSGWLAIAPGHTASTSTLNFPPGDNRANGFVSLFGPGGTLTVSFSKVGGSTHAVVDVLGYYR
jgi:spore germination protein YaaH